MTRTARRAGVAAALLGCLAVGACGGTTQQSGADARAARSIATTILAAAKHPAAASPARALDVRPAAARCIGTGLVDAVGVAHLQRYGLLDRRLRAGRRTVTDLRMSPRDASGAADVMVRCTDLEALVRRSMAAQMGHLNRAATRCLHRQLTDPALHGVFVDVFEGHARAAGRRLLAPLVTCVTG